jgi:hypothetical protein
MELVRAFARSANYRRNPDKLQELAKFRITYVCCDEIQQQSR